MQSIRAGITFLKNAFSTRPFQSTVLYVVFPVYIAIALFALVFGPPRFFPANTYVSVEEGMTIAVAAEAFESAGVVRNSFLFKVLATMFGGDSGVVAGTYVFEDPASVVTVAWRTTKGDYGIHPKRILVPEGATVADMAVIYGKRLLDFDESEFLREATKYEGYLFPDTYFFLPTAKPAEVIKAMRENFDEKISSIQAEIDAFGKSLEEVVIMASLLEKEARKLDTKRMIADVLWRRIEIDMPLQVDAVFPYIIGLNTFELSRADLNVDSPYNTYRYKGLPVGPIANPGIDSILAAVTPTENNYLFYLADHYGRTHYAVDFDGHIANRRKYLD